MTPYHIREAADHLGLGMEDVRECVHELGGTVWDEDDDEVSNRPAHACPGRVLFVQMFCGCCHHLGGADAVVLEHFEESRALNKHM